MAMGGDSRALNEARSGMTQALTLLVDADDTLWENNIYFERAFDGFCDFLAHSTLTAAQPIFKYGSVCKTAPALSPKIHPPP